jgi:putative membrane protein
VLYEWFKVFHIVGWTTWMFGLMQLLWFLSLDSRSADLHEPVCGPVILELRTTAIRLYRTTATPGMFLTLTMGIGLVSIEPEVHSQAWFLVKMIFVALLIGFHIYFGRLLDIPEHPSVKIKRLHHVPGITLVPIVILAVCKNELPTMPVPGLIFFASLATSGWQLLSALFLDPIQPGSKNQVLSQSEKGAQ